jgi:hypothetical protein
LLSVALLMTSTALRTNPFGHQIQHTSS